MGNKALSGKNDCDILVNIACNEYNTFTFNKQNVILFNFKVIQIEKLILAAHFFSNFLFAVIMICPVIKFQKSV